MEVMRLKSRKPYFHCGLSSFTKEYLSFWKRLLSDKLDSGTFVKTSFK